MYATLWHKEFLGRGSDASHSCDLNAGSLTHCGGPGIEPVSHRSQEATDPIVLQGELQGRQSLKISGLDYSPSWSPWAEEPIRYMGNTGKLNSYGHPGCSVLSQQISVGYLFWDRLWKYRHERDRMWSLSSWVYSKINSSPLFLNFGCWVLCCLCYIQVAGFMGLQLNFYVCIRGIKVF